MSSTLVWRRSGVFLDSDQGGYRVQKIKIVRRDRPSYFAFPAFVGKRHLGCFESGPQARGVCESHWAGVVDSASVSV